MNRPSRRAYFLITLFAFLLVLFPFLFWYGTWFGRKLSDSDIDQYLGDRSKPRRGQHALVQIGERMESGQDVSRWYPKVIELASSPNLELRQTAAWIMGQDRDYAPFREALQRALEDEQPMVRRNAALSLAAWDDAASRPELIAMLHPYTVTAPAAGAITYRLKVEDYVNPGTLIARIGETEVRSPVPGEVRAIHHADGSAVRQGDSLADLSADPNHIWEALRALYLVGQLEDLEAVERYTRPIPDMPEKVVQQASLTAQAIRDRAK
jgi:biotin carboxyl carrier protein